MAFLPSLQKSITPDVPIEILTSYGKENIRSSISMTSDDAVNLESFWAVDHVLSYSSFHKRNWDTNFSNLAAQQKTLIHGFSGIDKLESWFNVLALTRQYDYMLCSTSYNSEDGVYSWLDLKHYDLSAIKQIQEVRNALVHGLPLSTSRHTSEFSKTQSLEDLYTFKQPNEIQQFLDENAFLAQFLRDAYSNVRKYFPHSELQLEVVADPEAIEEKQLVLFIVVEDDPDAASLALDKLDEDWWLDAMDSVEDKLCIALEFE